MRSPVFIVGSPRSGTSALVDALLYAGYNGFREGSFMSMITPIQETIDRHFSIYAYDSQVLVSHANADSLKWRVAEILAETQSALNQHPWFDKTCNPVMILAIPVLRRLWPDSAFVFAKRRGIENILSRLAKFPYHTFEFHCTDWARNMSAWRSVRSGIPADSFIEVEQQEILLEPGKVARDLVRLLGLRQEYQAPLETALQATRAQETAPGTSGRRFTLGTTGWSQEMITIFLQECAEEMAAYGYTTDQRYGVVNPAG